MLAGFLESLAFWHWWIFAIVMVILETLAPGVIFLWLGLGAAATGVLLLAATGLEWQMQLIVFACLSVVSGLGGRRWVKRNPVETDQPFLNQRGAQYIGNSYMLDRPIENGSGKLRVGDSDWKINGADTPAGSRIKVVGIKGASLVVEPSEEDS